MESISTAAVLMLSTDRGLYTINTDTIIRVQSISNYSKLFFTNGKSLVVAKVLRWFEEELSAQQFSRIHRSHLVNNQFIHEYINGPTCSVRLLNGEEIKVSRRACISRSDHGVKRKSVA